MQHGQQVSKKSLFEEAKYEAELLFNKFQSTHSFENFYETNIEEIVKNIFGDRVSIKLAKLPDEIGGVTVPSKNGKWTITLNSIHSLTRRRFSLAHELYHALRSEGAYDLGDINQKLKEQLANYFAACILMPSYLVHSLWNKINVPLVERVSEMANELNVGLEAMVYRLRFLGLITPKQAKDLL